MDNTFSALANKTRRQILDFVKNNPACLVNDISRQFAMSRVAIMKHLKILEQANLLVTEKIGTSKHHYFNVIPIQQIYDRWTDEYSRFMASRLTGFKNQIEQQLQDDENEPEQDKKCS
ncbi:MULTISPECIES: ArsR/SmtB family transcription factor [Alteromonadaceae]|uniref:ArsR/SmtB family transcription factor n=1 Tax=Alteromonadaceae TaxID=72275 RepID=UPI001C0948D2|nr:MULTISPECIES: metalloregulator ArsR/SmtB family transcription factor [Aliiglaciecola]MBU2877668.1 helix-turn-helix domain-containing protein [Aliiglaciecola lipolytica]MDO6713121.1 metalloregulator ArsR/SmtB family transcription factor [Aliiglaciecola sp. 2_MG-2023]MDO6754113.1 metalloregulator ArsR/SmtB family transcription factor [Aliiglaciecola sp. 1_MG-2023]